MAGGGRRGALSNVSQRSGGDVQQAPIFLSASDASGCPAGSRNLSGLPGFANPDFDTCCPCGHQPDNLEVPITYSEHFGQIHLALRNYKDGSTDGIRRHAAIRLVAFLWRSSQRSRAG